MKLSVKPLKLLVISNIFLASICVFLLLYPKKEDISKQQIQSDTTAAPIIVWTHENALQSTQPPEVFKENVSGRSLLKALNNSISYYARKKVDDTLFFGVKPIGISHILLSLRDIQSRIKHFGLTDTFYNYLREEYQFFRSAADTVLFTGYYEACLKGALKKSSRFAYPLYRKPHDIITMDLSKFYFYEKASGIPRYVRGRLLRNRRFIPYFSREDIDCKDVLAGRRLEMVWVDDPVALFFLQIQGSGIIELDNGKTMRANYASGNGHEYKAIGKLLIEKGAFTYEEMSMQRIRQYLREHPEEMEEIFNYNPSYVFFTRGGKGPLGALGTSLIAMRSIATDLSLFPKGALGYIETEIPVFDSAGAIIQWKPFGALVLNQDTGGAITGPGRVDIFTGYGREAELIAGHMKQKGRLFFLIKKTEYHS